MKFKYNERRRALVGESSGFGLLSFPDKAIQFVWADRRKDMYTYFIIRQLLLQAVRCLRLCVDL